MSAVLGLSISHYTSACIVIDGKIEAAVMEERLSRKKFDGSFPHRSVRKVLEMTGLSASDIDRVAIGSLCEAFDPNLPQDKHPRYTTNAVSFASGLMPVSFMESPFIVSSYRKLFTWNNRREFFKKHSGFLQDVGISKEKIRFYDHHSCHSATAYYASPWRDNVLLFTCDGNGDGYCGTVGVGTNNHWEHKTLIPSIHSLGGLYAQATRYIGMNALQDEYKVMGLAPWGARKRQAAEVYKKFKSLWDVDGLSYRNRSGKACDTLLAYMNKTMKNVRFDYMAYCVQQLLEDTLSKWVLNNTQHYNMKKIACAGGVFYNIKANKAIVDAVQPEDIFVFPVSGDESTSIGAAYLAYEELKRSANQPVDIEPVNDVYWGEAIDTQIEAALKSLDGNAFRAESFDDLDEKVASLLADNHIVGVCRSRMEFGPRALGNRSILANPSDLRNVERVNNHIKNRDFWMPFALTIMKEHENKYIVNPGSIRAPYMIMGFDTKPEHRHEIVAGIHQADKSVRPQVLEQDFNPAYHRIISKFHEKTGIGAVLNTSLNMHGDPLINLPEEAIDMMKRSDLDYLVLGNYLITKQS